MDDQKNNSDSPSPSPATSPENSDVITTKASNPNPNPNQQQDHHIIVIDDDFDPFATPTPKPTPHKTPLFSQTVATATSNSFRKYPFCKRMAAAFHLLRHLRHLRTHLWLILLSLPSFYFLVWLPSRLDFLSVFAFLLHFSLPFLSKIFTHSSSRSVFSWQRRCVDGMYQGHYRNGLKHGFGVFRFHTGDLYAGQWSNGHSHGNGVQTCEDGSRYVGQFKWGVKHGLGLYHFSNGDTYAGESFADKIHGFGVYSYANDGHRYEGSWHEGKRQGLGMYTFKNGETQSGHWQNGVVDVPTSHAVYHSKVLNAIQEARRAAEKAYDVAKVS